MSYVIASKLATSDGRDVVNLDSISTTGYYSRQILTQVDTTSRTASTTWTLGATFPAISCLGNSKLLLDYYFPCRNDSTSWGGAYLEPQVSFDGGTSWNSLGGSGYDGGVMKNGNSAISYYYNQIYIDPGISSSFSARFRYYFRSYDGTLGINNGVNHDINVVSGVATMDGYGDNQNQHYCHFIVEELARYA